MKYNVPYAAPETDVLILNDAGICQGSAGSPDAYPVTIIGEDFGGIK